MACGVLGVGGNKGAVAVEFTLHRRKLAIVCSHFAAHQVRHSGVGPLQWAGRPMLQGMRVHSWGSYICASSRQQHCL